jgi:hypothetical protein
MTGKKKSSRAVNMSKQLKPVKIANPQTKVLSIASKQISGHKKSGGGLNLAPPRGTGMYLKPYR